ncbi:KTSC domain-containing protein [Pedobacter punctiformis]|uniref:KTSC domain-containing protein n=1 Tax=Pedobacter punctiformis TaxID=3004097 RepID=A0ABT4L7M0_9SPHI|nr:KTSC domain-containing protein [Pedobacter sp. HCMS5-2]MCZ4243919.1 KTSC domain-containing protein [Pedobacter sp. HCMS5-2]
MPSSVINHFSYNIQSHTLKITFVTGLTYQYSNVPQEIYDMLKAVKSKGKYFNDAIRNKYKYKKLKKHQD